MTFRPKFLALILALLPGACGGQAGPDYTGGSFGTLHGTVQSPPDATSESDLQVVILWDGPADIISKGRPTDYISFTSTLAGFPGKFTMDILDPPPPVLSQANGKEFSSTRLGLIAVVPAEALARGLVTADDVRGVALYQFLLYFHAGKGDAEVDYTAEWFNVPPTKGYHLSQSEVTVAREAAYWRCNSPGLCMRDMAPKEAGDNTQRFNDDQFALCQKYLPDVPTCTYFNQWPETELSPEQLAESKLCIEQKFANPPKEACTPPWVHVPNPENLEHPVTIYMGKSVEDALIPSAVPYPTEG